MRPTDYTNYGLAQELRRVKSYCPEIIAEVIRRLMEVPYRAALSSPAKVGGDERDHIALAKAMLVLVDEYHERPMPDTRTALRVALTDEFRKLLARAALSADATLIFERQQDGFERCYEALGITDDRERSWSALVLAINSALSADGGDRKDANKRD